MSISKEGNQRQVIMELGSKYLFNENHALFVENAALQLFDALLDLNTLALPERVLLSHSSLLHDIGNYISEKKHHKHTQYIIDHDDALQYYPEKEKHLVSLIAFNHRQKLSKSMDLLSKSERETVLRLSAILRVADSVDYARQEVSIKGICHNQAEVKITISGVLPERLDSRLLRKKELFCKVFNLDIQLEME